jgi:hypothetical protein
MIEDDRTGEIVDDTLLAYKGGVQSKSRCANCGSDEKLREKMIVPEEAKGTRIESNLVVLCRACSLAADSAVKAHSKGTRPVNFWVSRELHTRLLNGLGERNGFHSMGQMVRFLMSRYVTDQDLFDDLYQYQDSRAAEVKVNVWVEASEYGTFKTLVDYEGHTVTETLKCLIRMYECEVEPLMRRKSGKE